MMLPSLPRPIFLLLIIAALFVFASLSWMISSPLLRESPWRQTVPEQDIGAESRFLELLQEAQPCQPQNKVVFLKTHKTGSTTIASIIQRFGYLNNLTFLLPNHAHFINYRKMFSADDITSGWSNSSTTHWSFDVGYDVLSNHARYNRREMEKVVHDARYVTILREPSAQFESAFYYFEIWRSMPRSKEPLKLFMEDPEKYYDLIMQSKRQYYKDSMHNQHMFDFGMEHGEMSNDMAIERKIRDLDSEFDLVMITEYFDESLILLRKLLCWEMSDIIYLAKAKRALNYRSEISDNLRSLIRSWNRADVLLYEHFNQTFWHKVNDYGPDFSRDLAIFRQKLAEASGTCLNSSHVNTKDRRVEVLALKDSASNWCRLLGKGDVDYTALLRTRMQSLGLPMYTYHEPRKQAPSA